MARPPNSIEDVPMEYRKALAYLIQKKVEGLAKIIKHLEDDSGMQKMMVSRGEHYQELIPWLMKGDKHDAPPQCTCSYNDSEEMTSHAPLCEITKG